MTTLGNLFALLGREQFIAAFLHRVVLKQGLAQDALALGQESFFVILNGVTGGNERITRFADFRPHVDRQRFEAALSLPILRG